jgi:PAS domain S-box-containing protein
MTNPEPAALDRLLRTIERQLDAAGAAVRVWRGGAALEAARGAEAGLALRLANEAGSEEGVVTRSEAGGGRATASARVDGCRVVLAAAGSRLRIAAGEAEALADLAAMAAAALAAGEGPGAEKLRAAIVERIAESGDAAASLSAIAESEAAFRALFRRNPVPMCIHEARTMRPMQINAAMANRYGWNWERLRGMSLLDILDAPQHAAAIAGWQATEGGLWRIRRPDGSVRSVQVSAHAARFDGRDAWLAAFWDVTEQAWAEEQLRRSRASLVRQARELRHAQRLARIASWRLDDGSDRFDWPPETHALFGTDRTAFAPTLPAVLDLVEGEDRAGLGAALEVRQEVELTVRLRSQDGRRRWLHIEGRRDEAEDEPPGLWGYVQDVTEAREAEAAMLRTEKLRSIGQLTGGIAHDFNNLLTVTGVNLEIAEERLARGEEAEDVVAAARQAVQRGARLTRQLLNYARRQPLPAVRLRLTEFLPPITELLRRSLGERYAVALELAEDTPDIQADAAQLEAALLNLCLNAQDAMPTGGSIAIRAGRFEAVASLAEEGPAPGPYAVLEVSDTGAGIPREQQPRIFEAFFTTKEPGKGTGLGLSMVSGFVRQAGGFLTLESEPGQGATFRLHLPAAETPPAGEAAPEEPADLPRAELLVVEDDNDVRAAVTRLCQELGLEVWSTRHPQEALAMLRAGFRFDLLFTDLVLGGGLEGPELAREARRAQSDIAVLFTSGYPAEGPERPAGQWPVEGIEADLLPKPYDQARFRAAVAQALAKRPG